MSDVEPTTEDELVSAYLDNEVTEAERAEVEADSVLTAMVGRFDTSSQLMSGTIAAPPDVRERSVAAALDAFDQQQRPTGQHLVDSGDSDNRSTPAVEEPVAPVVSLASVRRNRRLVTVIGAAAATLIAVMGVSAFLPQDDDTAATAAYETADAAAGDAAEETDLTESSESKAALTPALTPAESVNESNVVSQSRQANSFVQTPVDLDEQPDTAAASDAFLTVLNVDTEAITAATPQLEPAEAASVGDDDRASELTHDPFVECLASYRADGAVVPGVGMRANVQIGDVPALVFEITDAEGNRERLVILDETSCDVLEERDL